MVTAIRISEIKGVFQKTSPRPELAQLNRLVLQFSVFLKLQCFASSFSVHNISSYLCKKKPVGVNPGTNIPVVKAIGAPMSSFATREGKTRQEKKKQVNEQSVGIVQEFKT